MMMVVVMMIIICGIIYFAIINTTRTKAFTFNIYIFQTILEIRRFITITAAITHIIILYNF